MAGTNNYRCGTTKKYGVQHLAAHEITQLFQTWGIIGERRSPVVFMKRQPQFDKGAGPT